MGAEGATYIIRKSLRQKDRVLKFSRDCISMFSIRLILELQSQILVIWLFLYKKQSLNC